MDTNRTCVEFHHIRNEPQRPTRTQRREIENRDFFHLKNICVYLYLRLSAFICGFLITILSPFRSVALSPRQVIALQIQLSYNKYESNHSWKIMVQQIDAPPTIISPHPLDRVFEDLAYLVKSLETELDVAPHDRAAHQDLLRRIQKIAETALTIPDEVWPKSVNLPEGVSPEITPEEKAFIDSIEWVTVGEIGQEFDVEAINKRLKERGYEIQIPFPETSET
jgi:hypothetical protein